MISSRLDDEAPKIEQLRKLLAEATPGPWFAASREYDDESWWIWSAEQEDGTPFTVAKLAYEGPDLTTDGEAEEADAALIAAARNALPWLLDRLVEAEQREQRVRELAQRLWDAGDYSAAEEIIEALGGDGG